MKKINKLAIVGGTHGNEFTGIYLVKKFEEFPELISRRNFDTQFNCVLLFLPKINVSEELSVLK